MPFFFLSTRFSVAVLGFLGLVAMTSQELAIKLILPCMLNDTSFRLLPPDDGTYATYATSREVSLSLVKSR